MIEVETAVVYDRIHRMRIADLLHDPCPTVKNELVAIVDETEDDAWEEWWREQDRKLELAIAKKVS